MAEIGIFQVLLIMISLFFVLLIVKEFFPKRLKKKFCVICAAITLTWVFFLVLFLFGGYGDRILLALLMGQTILGAFYLVEKASGRRSLKRLKLFRLPFLLTLLFVAYSVLAAPSDFFKSAVLLVALWLLFFLVYFLSKNSGKGFIKKLIDCCRNI